MSGWQRWHHRARDRVAHSIRARLVLLFVLLALATTAVFLAGTQRIVQAGWQGLARPLLADYADRLAAEIGSPPDPARARALAARLPLTVRIDGPQVQFDSHPSRRDDDADAHAAGYGLARTTADGHRIRFGLAWFADSGRPRRLGWITLAALLALTALAWAVVNRLLAPLAAIGDGAARFGRGDFATPIAVRRRDELGDLAERVNGMADSLRSRLDDQRALLLAISHELRSPLTRARLNAELVEGGEPRDALLRDLAEMRELIATLLESQRIADGAPALQCAALDLGALARSIAPAGWTLELAEVPAVWADETRLRLLLRNLVANAERHAAGAARPPTLYLRRQDDGRLALGVRDQGPGVAADQLPRLAQPFYRPDAARTREAGGVGLGLYLCRLVAQAHGGELRIADASPGLDVAMVWRPGA